MKFRTLLTRPMISLVARMSKRRLRCQPRQQKRSHRERSRASTRCTEPGTAPRPAAPSRRRSAAWPCCGPSPGTTAAWRRSCGWPWTGSSSGSRRRVAAAAARRGPGSSGSPTASSRWSWCSPQQPPPPATATTSPGTRSGSWVTSTKLLFLLGL